MYDWLLNRFEKSLSIYSDWHVFKIFVLNCLNKVKKKSVIFSVMEAGKFPAFILNLASPPWTFWRKNGDEYFFYCTNFRFRYFFSPWTIFLQVQLARRGPCFKTKCPFQPKSAKINPARLALTWLPQRPLKVNSLRNPHLRGWQSLWTPLWDSEPMFSKSLVFTV